MFKYTRPRTHLLLKRASGWLVVRCVEALKQYAARYSANVPHHPRSVVSTLSGLFLRTLQNIIAANFCFRRLCGILPSSTSSPSPHCSYMHTFFVYMYVPALTNVILHCWYLNFDFSYFVVLRVNVLPRFMAASVVSMEYRIFISFTLFNISLVFHFVWSYVRISSMTGQCPKIFPNLCENL